MIEKKRIIILGIDGLEYNLVNEWDLQYLKQNEYRKTDLSDFGVIVTPLIWASMITGQKIKKIEQIFLQRAKYFSKQSKGLREEQKQFLAARILKNILPTKIKKGIIRHILPDPFEKTQNYVIEKKITTIFDFFQSSWTNGIPTYGRNILSKEVRNLVLQATKGDTKPLYKYSMDLFTLDKNKLYDALEKQHQLLFWYTPFLDEIEHFYITKKAKISNIYFELNQFVKDIRKKLGKNDRLYIISDHGMEPIGNGVRAGEHSFHGFFSSNTTEIIEKPQDLYHLIKKLSHN